MPKFLEDKLRQEYGNNPRAIFGTMNKVGAMHGNKETDKGRSMEAKHAAKPFAMGGIVDPRRKRYPWEPDPEAMPPQPGEDQMAPPPPPDPRAMDAAPDQTPPPPPPGPPPMPPSQPQGPPPPPMQQQGPPPMPMAGSAPPSGPPQMGPPPDLRQQGMPPMPQQMAQAGPPPMPGRPPQAPPPPPRIQGSATQQYMDQSQRVANERPRAWQNVLGALGSISPVTRGIDVHPNITRDRQNLGLYKARADEERALQQAQSNEEIKKDTLANNADARATSLAMRTATVRPPPPVNVAPGGTLVDPTTGQPIYQSPAAPPRPMSVAPGGTLVDPTTGKPTFTAPPIEKPSKADDLTETIAAKEQIANQRGLKGAERQHFIYGTPMPPAGNGGLAGGGAGPVTPEQSAQLRKEAAANPALDYDAWAYLLEGKLQVRGIGAAATAGAEKIKQRAGQIMGDLGVDPGELYARRGELKGGLGAYAKLTTTAAQISAFEGTLQRNAKIAQKLSDDYARGDLRLYNRVLSAFKTGKGDQEALNLSAQLHGLAREWGKIMAGSTSSMGVPISEANAADEFFSKGISNGQLSSLISNVILPDAQSRTAANEEEKGRLVGTLRGLTRPQNATSNPPSPQNTNPTPVAAPKVGDIQQHQGHNYKFDGTKWVLQ